MLRNLSGNGERMRGATRPTIMSDRMMALAQASMGIVVDVPGSEWEKFVHDGVAFFAATVLACLCGVFLG